MSSANLIRLGGLSAILAGILRAVASFLPSTTPDLALDVLYLFTDVFILLGTMGLYGFQHEEIGLSGFLGFLLGIVGIGIIIGRDVMIFGANVYPVGALVFAGGLDLLAIGSLIAKKLPRWIPVFWIFSTLVGPIGYFVQGFGLLFVISGAMFGLSFAGAGISVWSAASNQLLRNHTR